MMRIKQLPTSEGRWFALVMFVGVPFYYFGIIETASNTSRAFAMWISIPLMLLFTLMGVLAVCSDLVWNSRFVEIDLEARRISVHQKNFFFVYKSEHYPLGKFDGVISYLGSWREDMKNVALLTTKDNKHLYITGFPTNPSSSAAQLLRAQLAEALKITNRGFIGYGDVGTHVRPDKHS
jgi:hypothetical protein